MTNDDAKYREWWEKLKGELSRDPNGFCGDVLIWMQRIENEAPK